MERDTVSAEKKIDNLLRFIKHAGVRDPITLGIIFNLWNAPELLDAAVFLADPTSIPHEPILFIEHDNSMAQTKLRIDDLVIDNLNGITEELLHLETFYIYVSFPNNIIPDWHLNICRGRELLTKGVWQPPQIMNEPFKSIYKQALLILIDGALDSGDRNRFMALTEEWKKIA